MPLQEVEALRPSSSRSGCILRPNNKCVLDDSVPMQVRPPPNAGRKPRGESSWKCVQERILVPPCPLAPHLMMEDIGIASPLYDLCSTLGITAVYSLPIDLVPWPVPYPIGVPWPVITYGPMPQGAEGESARDRGYVVVSPGQWEPLQCCSFLSVFCS